MICHVEAQYATPVVRQADASIETKASKAWIIKPTVSGVKREAQCLLKIGILATDVELSAEASNVFTTAFYRAITPGNHPRHP